MCLMQLDFKISQDFNTPVEWTWGVEYNLSSGYEGVHGDGSDDTFRLIQSEAANGDSAYMTVLVLKRCLLGCLWEGIL